MNKFKILIIMAGLFSWLTSCKGQQSENNNFQDDKFKEGQVWKYNTRSGEENSTITILKVEKYDKQNTERLTAVWQNGGFSAKLNIRNF
jgi:hypothetical protein